MATVDILPNNEVNVTVPHCDGAGTAQTSVFRGPKKSHTKECVLIIDHNTGEITLERLSHNIQLKKTRYYFIFIRKHAVFPCKAVLLIKPHLSFFLGQKVLQKLGNLYLLLILFKCLTATKVENYPLIILTNHLQLLSHQHYLHLTGIFLIKHISN